MPIKYRNGLTAPELLELEKEIGMSLPDDYKKFLSEWNGFNVFPPTYGTLEYDKVDNGEIEFFSFYGFQVKNKNFDIVAFNRQFIDELDFLGDPVLAIGDDGGRQSICFNSKWTKSRNLLLG